MRPDEPIAARWWPITESQSRYGVSPSTTRRLVAEGLIEARKVGARTLIDDISMDRYVVNQPRHSIRPDVRSAKLARRVTCASD
jgi:hypothetical protein